MLTYDLSGKKHLFDALYTAIKNDIICGRIKPGEKLPSKRSLAEHLKVSKVTVENAYSQLKAEGYIYSIEKKGYFAERAEAPLAASKPPAPPSVTYREVPEADLTGRAGKSMSFPFSVWIRLMREVSLSRERELLAPLPQQGALPLREAVSGYLYRNRGISASADNIIIGAGTQYLYSLLVQLLGRDMIYAAEDPGYDKVRLVINAAGARCMGIPMDENGVDVSALYKSGANVLHISPAHHFPLGTVTSAARRAELFEWVKSRGEAYIIEDDYDCEFRMSGKPISPMQATDSMDCVIYMNTFSKSLCPSLRISYMVLPEPLIKRYRARLGFASCTVPSFEQYTLAAFISSGYFEKHISRMKKHYRFLRDYAVHAVTESEIGEYVKVHEADAGLHFIIEVKTQLSDNEFCAAARRRGLWIKSLSDYCLERHGEFAHRFVFNYSGADAENIDTAVKILKEIICP